MNYDSYRDIFPRPNILLCDKKIVTPSGELKCLGIFKTDIGYKQASIRDDIYVLPKNMKTSNLLSRNAAKKLSIVKYIGGINLEDDLFCFDQWRTEPVKLHMKNDAVPSAIHCACNIPFSLREPVKQALNQMVKYDNY